MTGGTPAAAATTAPLLRCSVRVGDDCQREATDLLLVAAEDGEWVARPRCDKHPAESYVPLLRRMSPLLACVVVPLPARQVGAS